LSEFQTNQKTQFAIHNKAHSVGERMLLGIQDFDFVH